MSEARHLVDQPDPTFWLDELRLPDFARVCRLADEPARLRAIVGAEFGTPEARRVLDAIVAELGDGDPVYLNLLLVSAFLRNRKSAAVADVAAAVLSADVYGAHRSDAGRVHRLPLLTLLYRRDPRHLVSVDLWDRWHSRRRCVLEVEGHARRDAGLAGRDWETLANQSLGDVQTADRLAFRAAVARRGGTEVLVAFRSAAAWSTVRTDTGAVVNGRDDDWTLLLFYDGGNAVDVTADDLERGTALANAIASRMWGTDVRYRPVRRELRDKDIRQFLSRCIDPDDDTFPLVEMVAEGVGVPDRPIVVVSNGGEERIEHAVGEFRKQYALGYDWRTVHTVKLAFDEGYRIPVHLPAPGEDLVLTYSDVDRNKEVSRRFEAMFADELGVVIRPKVARAVSRSRIDKLMRPKKVTAAHVAALLAPVVDDPPSWARELLQEFARDGHVRLSWRSAFRCGDASVGHTAAADSLDCSGIVELAYGDVDPEDPFQQEDDSQATCPRCGRVWHPRRSRLPLLPRVRVTPDHKAIWALVLEEARKLCALTQESPGVATGMFRGKRVYLAYAPLVEDLTRLELGLASQFAVCWVDVATPRGYRERGVGLAEILVERTGPISACWKLGRDAALAGQPAPGLAPPLLAAEPQEPRPTKKPKLRTFTVDETGVWLDGEEIGGPTAHNIRLVLALLWEAARRDDAAQEERRLRSVGKLGALGSTKFTEQAVSLWMTRLRNRLEAVAGEGADDIVKWKRGVGYALGDKVSCVGIALEAEIATHNTSRRPPAATGD